ncbi:Nif3-like dinuclear metal center hexameric protein [Actinomycetospora sp. TBRC 11914]|uniref:Nif3-like dinuclear metal center hexameric protein n=1 Tax=Actinomycetospora sp. TBRC 11914 TaxID=2729387 RepID=UPI00145E72E4|nr:Nif3-like dinuclear metal center hexameric protein [Actinomycetospora sp. TBRC 11914]NMO90522.1 Nif3-like dinuclear metal center hexameric protein [Actinomycetospora sp. TBRC 11914]
MDPSVAPPDVAAAVAALETAYPPGLAQDWDAVGLVCGDPDEPVTRVLVAVDPTAAVVDDAIADGVDLLVTHHPLLLRGVHGVPADQPKGSVVHRLVRAGCALFAAHTNADAAAPGVSDALADALGVVVERPLAPEGPDGSVGIGRIGHLEATEPFGAFVERVAAALPATAWGVRGAGDPERPIRRVALSGGAGDSMLGLARDAGVDAYVTADLRHHPADEHLQRAGAPALVDVAHWASEHPWCAQAADVLRRALPGVTVSVSTRRTDPWTLGAAGSGVAERAAPPASTTTTAPPTMHDVIEGATQP